MFGLAGRGGTPGMGGAIVYIYPCLQNFQKIEKDSMKDDLSLIEKNIESKSIKVYLAGDVHIGSEEFNNKKWEAFIKLIKEDDDAFVIFCGDLIDVGLKNSKTNIYHQTMSPSQQKRQLITDLLPIKDKILCMVSGNHCDRLSKDVDMYPLYDVCVVLGIEDIYRDAMALIDIGIGERDKKTHYYGCVMHKTNKTAKYHYADTIDGIDFYVSGHTHTPMDLPNSKVFIDKYKKTVSIKPVETIVVPSFLDYGGYALKAPYRAPSSKMYCLVLSDKGYQNKGIETKGFYICN